MIPVTADRETERDRRLHHRRRESYCPITGGTAGIGEATVRRVAELGARTVFVGRDDEDGRRIESELLRYSSTQSVG